MEEQSLLIRRNQETDHLKEAFKKMQEGHFQVRFISGEAGTGKSVLTQMFLEEVAIHAEKTIVASSFCSLPSEYNIPYHPFKEILKSLVQDVQQNTAKSKCNKEKMKELFNFSTSMLLTHAPDLIGSLIPGGSILSSISQSIIENSNILERLKKTNPGDEVSSVDESKIIEQFVDFIRAVSTNYNIVLFIDDLQWIDKPSVDLLYQLIVSLRNCPILIIGCYRSDDVDITTGGQKHPLQRLINEVKINIGKAFIQLDNLSETERRKFMNAILDAEPNEYTDSFKQKLFEHTGGNPLFVNEIMNLFKEEQVIELTSGGQWKNREHLDWHDYPVRIEGIIQERVSKLEDSLVEILSHASVQGHHFILQVLSRTMEESERDLLMSLSKKLQKQHHLVEEGDCTRSRNGFVSRFNFSNYIFQQYFYQELSLTQRMILHSDIAVILEEMFKDGIEEVAGDIAYHYEMSGESGKALKYMLITVNSMMKISAFENAISLLLNVLKHLDELPDDYDHSKIRLETIVKLGLCYRNTLGWGSKVPMELFTEAKILSKKLHLFDYIDTILYCIWIYYFMQIELDKCVELARRNVSKSKELHNVKGMQTAYVTLINTLFWIGDFREVQKTLVEFKTITETMDNAWEKIMSTNAHFYFMFSSITAFEMGDYENARRFNQEMEVYYSKSLDNFALAIVYHIVAWVEYLFGNYKRCKEYAVKVIQLSEKYSFAYYLGVGKLFYGAALGFEDKEKGIQILQEGYYSLIPEGGKTTDISHPFYGYLLNSIYLHYHMYDECLASLVQIIPEVKENNEKCYLGELYYQKAKCLKAMNLYAEAEVASEEALQVVEETGAVHVRNMLLQL